MFLKVCTDWAHFLSAAYSSWPTVCTNNTSNMFDKESRLTFVKSVVESADSGIESAHSASVSTANPLKIGLWVPAFILTTQLY